MKEPETTETLVTYQKNWPVILFLVSAPFIAVGFVAADLAVNGLNIWNLLNFGLMYLLCGLGITAGYHRYYSHRAYEAHRLLQVFYAIFGAASLQNSLLFWVSNHRYHHRFTDTEMDPYDIKKGFFFAHMGWMFYKNPPNRPFLNVADLKKDPLVMWQHRYYWWIVLLAGFGLPTFLALCMGILGKACFGSDSLGWSSRITRPFSLTPLRTPLAESPMPRTNPLGTR